MNSLCTYIYNSFPETISGVNLVIKMNKFTLYALIHDEQHHSTHLFTSSLFGGHLQIQVNLL